MEYTVKRTFHPVGQGAFYSERHNDFNIVYDCGAMPLSQSAKYIVGSAFLDEEIDILFISHFDYDHVSAISALQKSVKKIKRVVLPLLNDKHKCLLVNINRALSQNIVTLINTPEVFFGDGTDIIYVKSVDEEPENSGDGQSIDLNEVPSKRDNKTKSVVIDSGSKLYVSQFPFWTFIPFNYRNKDRTSQLISALIKAGLDTKKLQSDESYTLSKITTPNFRKALRKAYSTVDGNVNENSMLLYSGPSKQYINEYEFICGSTKVEDLLISCGVIMAGCIYTGDCDLNKIYLPKVFGECSKFVGTIQIPHHGSKHNFCLNSFSDFWPHELLCPISYGTKNLYGHPATHIVNQLSLYGLRPILVNEHWESGFSQKILIEHKQTKKFRRVVESI